MSLCNRNSTACSFLGILMSIVLGALVGVLYAFCQIPYLTTGLWIMLGLGVFSFLFLFIGLYLAANTAFIALSKSLCKHVICMLIGIIGTIISALILLAAPLNFAYISNIVIVSVGAFFLALLIIELINFVICIARKMCCPPICRN